MLPPHLQPPIGACYSAKYQPLSRSEEKVILTWQKTAASSKTTL